MKFNNYIERGRIPAEDPTEFVDPDLNPGSGPVTLAIRAEDFCDNDLSIRTATTMLAEASLDTCELLVNMNWTPYEDWEEGVSAYEIRALVDGAEEFLTTVGPELNEVEVQVEPNKEYILFVRAISNGGQRPSNSNGIRMLTEYPKIIEYQYLHSVSTNQQNQIEVNLLQDTTGVGTLYELYRAENEGMFRLIRTFQGSEEEFLTYVDSDVRPGDTEYTYFWRAFDGCGQLIGDSNQGVNIVLTARVNNDQPVVRLNWTPYETWENGVESYNIWRSPGSPDEFELLATVDSDETQLEEDIESFAEEEGRFCYRIEALEAESQFPKASAFSNISCVVQPPIIWVPNAMVYGGFNDEFKPVLSFIEFDSYQMEIYNKWGELLFATNDYQEGWDGTYRGNPVREDYYRYIIKFQDGAGKVTLEEGVLYVLNEGD